MSRETFERVAAEITRHVPSKHNAVEILACAYQKAQELSGGNFISTGIWKAATAAFLEGLPGNEVEAERIIKTTASEVLGDPFILENFERREASKLKVAEAEAELEAAELEVFQRARRKRELADEIKKLSDERARWDVDWLAVGKEAEEVIAEKFGKPFASPYDSSLLQQAWNNHAAAPLLSRLAPEQVKKLTGQIAKLEAELRELTPAPQDAAQPRRQKQTVPADACPA